MKTNYDTVEFRQTPRGCWECFSVSGKYIGYVEKHVDHLLCPGPYANGLSEHASADIQQFMEQLNAETRV